MPEKLGKALRLIREARDLPLRELSARARISTPYLSLIEGGARSPSVETLTRLAQALNVPMDFFLLIASSAPKGLTSSEHITNRLVKIFERLERIERELQDAIDQD